MEKEILEMLKRQNRPFSLQTVINYTESKYSKTKVQQALQSLVDEALITYLEVGKSGKLYFFNEEKLKVLTADEETETLREIDKEERVIDELQQERIEKQNICQSFKGRLTAEEYSQKITLVKEQLEALQIDDSQEVITDEVMEKARAECLRTLKAWKARQLMVKDALEALADAIQKNPKDIREELGLEETKNGKEIAAMIATIK